MISTILNWFGRSKPPTLREASEELSHAAETMNKSLRELAECDCMDNLQRVMDRARRRQGVRTRSGDP